MSMQKHFFYARRQYSKTLERPLGQAAAQSDLRKIYLYPQSVEAKLIADLFPTAPSYVFEYEIMADSEHGHTVKGQLVDIIRFPHQHVDLKIVAVRRRYFKR